MGNDIVAYKIAIGSFDLRTRSVVVNIEKIISMKHKNKNTLVQ
jgi:hypothetical protein